MAGLEHKKRRIALGFTVEEFADELNELPALIEQIEADRRKDMPYDGYIDTALKCFEEREERKKEVRKLRNQVAALAKRVKELERVSPRVTLH